MSVEILDLGALALTAVFFALLYYLHKKKQVDFGVRTILAVGLGLIVGLAFKGHHTYVAAVGTIYAHVVSAVVIPLLIFSIISSITNLGNSVRLKQIGLKTVFFLVLNTFIASLITLIAGVATNIGSGVQYELATDYTAKEVPTFVDTVISLFPQNLAAHWSNGEVVPIVVFCILVAVSYNKIAAKKPEEVAPFKKFIDAGDLVMGRVVSYVISFTPYAVLSLIARAVSRSSPADLIPLLSVLVLAYVLCGIQVFVVESALIKFVGKLSPVRFFKGIWPAATVAFTSQSSVGTIPVTVNQLTRKLGVNEDVRLPRSAGCGRFHWYGRCARHGDHYRNGAVCRCRSAGGSHHPAFSHLQHRGYGAYRYERCGCGYRHHPCGRYRRAAGHCRLQWHGGDARGRSLRVTSKNCLP